MKQLLAVATLGVAMGLVSAFASCGPDSCPPGQPMIQTSTASCQLLQADAGPLEGVTVACERSDAGDTTGADGAFSLPVGEFTCGINAGGTDCDTVHFTQDGGELTVEVEGSGVNPAQRVHAFTLIHSNSGSCRVIAR